MNLFDQTTSAHRAPESLAESVRRTADRLDPQGLPGPFRDPQREASQANSEFLFRLLPRIEDSVGAGIRTSVNDDILDREGVEPLPELWVKRVAGIRLQGIDLREPFEVESGKPLHDFIWHVTKFVQTALGKHIAFDVRALVRVGGNEARLFERRAIPVQQARRVADVGG